MENFLPRDDAQFAEWLAHFNVALADNFDRLDLAPADLAPCVHAETEMASALAMIRQAEEMLQEARLSLQTARAEGENAARALIGTVRDRDDMPMELRRQLHLPVARTPRRRRTHSRPELSAPPAPGGLSANIEPDGTHNLRWYANGNTAGTDYIIEAASGADLQRRRSYFGHGIPVQAARWTQVAVTKRLEYTHCPSQSGQPILYRIKARNQYREGGYSENLYVTPSSYSAANWRSRVQAMLARRAPAPFFPWRTHLRTAP